MEVNTLMLGDLVEYNGYVCRVYSISLPFPRTEEKYSNKSIITLWCNGFISVTEDDIEPIPITEEIIQKNDFHRNEVWNKGYYSYDAHKNDLLFAMDFYFGTKGQKEFGSAGKRATLNNWKCEYVHELQHALRLCGLSELADNFKV